jgi:hypothetical protein
VEIRALSGLPAWGWAVLSTFAGYGAGVAHSFFLHRPMPHAQFLPKYCPRCREHFAWIREFRKELKTKL